MKTIKTAQTQQHSQTMHSWLSSGLWIIPLVLLNLGLIASNTPSTSLSFNPIAVGQGQWWRLLSGFFVHVSRYHLLIDGIAFILLYKALTHHPLRDRATLLLGCALGSLLLPVIADARIDQLGLCGLSGIAHGLMAILSAEKLGDKRERAFAATLLVGLIAKVAWEMVSGSAFLQGVHPGDIGVPIVSTHAGGVIGGLTAWWLGQRAGRRCSGGKSNHPKRRAS